MTEGAAVAADRSSWLDKDHKLAEEDVAFLERLSKFIVERRMAPPALLFLESVKPLNFVGSQAMFFFEPIVKIFVGGEGYTRFATLMERRENLELFLRCIEATEASRRHRGGKQ